MITHFVCLTRSLTSNSTSWVVTDNAIWITIFETAHLLKHYVFAIYHLFFSLSHNTLSKELWSFASSAKKFHTYSCTAEISLMIFLNNSKNVEPGTHYLAEHHMNVNNKLSWCGRLSWLNCQLSSARYYSIFAYLLMLTNPRDAFVGQSRSSNVVTFHMLDIASSCAIVTLSLRRAIFPIFDFKNVVTLKSGSEVTRGHWMVDHSIACVWFLFFLLVFFSNFVPKTYRFWDIWLQKCRDLENRVNCPLRSLIISPRSLELWLYLVSFLRYSMSKNVATLKSGSNVTQGYREWYHAIECVWIPISVL